jgi:hypothetical protein
MSKNQYTISLTAGQRKALRRIISAGDAPAFKIKNARILLKTDSSKGGGNRVDQAIAREFNLNVSTVERIQQRFLERGLETAINQRPQAKNLVVNSAPDSGTLVDFGVGKVSVNPDGSTFVSYPGGSVNVDLNGGTGSVTDSTTGVNVTPTGNIDVNFPGGGVFYDPIKGFSINYPGGGVFYDPAKGLVVKYPGGEVTYPLNNGVFQFPGGSVNVGQNGATAVNFPGGSVNVGAGGVTFNSDSSNGSV